MTGSGKYFGLAGGVDGKLYCAPMGGSGVLEINPQDETMRIIECDVVGGGWFDIAAFAGKLYCAPFDASGVLVVTPAREIPSPLHFP